VSPGGAGFCGVGATSTCTRGCTGTVLHDCDDAGVDIGLDCDAFGAQACAADAGAFGCKVRGTPCTPTSVVTCNNGVATGCPAGSLETVKCGALNGVAGDTACDPNAPGPAWDVSRACFNNGATGTCVGAVDSCSDAGLSSCHGGINYQTTCVAPFTGCVVDTTIDGPGARCGLPDGGR
jgi:hypothetical protein